MKTATAPLDYDASGHTEAPFAATERAVDRFRKTLHLWRQRSKTRRALAELSPRMLEDVGLEAAEAAREANKPFWRT